MRHLILSSFFIGVLSLSACVVADNELDGVPIAEPVVIETCDLVDSDFTQPLEDGTEIIDATGAICANCFCDDQHLDNSCDALWPGSKLSYSKGDSGNCSNSMCAAKDLCNTGRISCVLNGINMGAPVGAAPKCSN